jgi:hypothetical protein
MAHVLQDRVGSAITGAVTDVGNSRFSRAYSKSFRRWFGGGEGGGDNRRSSKSRRMNPHRKRAKHKVQIHQMIFNIIIIRLVSYLASYGFEKSHKKTKEKI